MVIHHGTGVQFPPPPPYTPPQPGTDPSSTQASIEGMPQSGGGGGNRQTLSPADRVTLCKPRGSRIECKGGPRDVTASTIWEIPFHLGPGLRWKGTYVDDVRSITGAGGKRTCSCLTSPTNRRATGRERRAVPPTRTAPPRAWRRNLATRVARRKRLELKGVSPCVQGDTFQEMTRPQMERYLLPELGTDPCHTYGSPQTA